MDISPEAIVVGALTFTAGLAWNEAAKSGIRAALPEHSNNFWGQLVYAVMVTLLILVAAYGVRNLGESARKVVEKVQKDVHVDTHKDPSKDPHHRSHKSHRTPKATG